MADAFFWWIGLGFSIAACLFFLACAIGGSAYLVMKQSNRLHENAVTMAGNRKAARDIALWAKAGRPPVPEAWQTGLRYAPPPPTAGAYGRPAARPEGGE